MALGNVASLDGLREVKKLQLRLVVYIVYPIRQLDGGAMTFGGLWALARQSLESQ